MRKLRSYKKIFSPKRVTTISALLEELDDLNDPGYKLYTSEIQGCLLGGLLLAAVSLTTPLLELFVRDLTVAYRIVRHHDGNMKLRGKSEREIEADRNLGFSQMVDELKLTVLKPEDGAKLRTFYEETRIPLAHGLVRRLTGSVFGVEELDDIFADSARHSRFESRIEDGAIADIQFVVRILKTYQPWLLRRLQASDLQE